VNSNISISITVHIEYLYIYNNNNKGTKDNGAAPLSLFFSSMSNINTVFGGIESGSSVLRFPTVRSTEVDNEGDGLFDSLEVILTQTCTHTH